MWSLIFISLKAKKKDDIKMNEKYVEAKIMAELAKK